MAFGSVTRRSLRGGEHGFTLPEVLIVVALMGILAAIAIPSWFAVTEGRATDSAANQLAADLRRAHSSAVNRLTNYQVVLTANNSTYQVGPSGTLRTRTLPDNTDAGTSRTITFCSSGQVSASTTDCSDPTEAVITVQVRATNDDAPRSIQLTPATSRVRVVP